jgi:hypothetical protein
VLIVHAYQTSQYVVPRGGISLGKWRSTFAGSSDGEMNVQSACALNTRYYSSIFLKRMRKKHEKPYPKLSLSRPSFYGGTSQKRYRLSNLLSLKA